METEVTDLEEVVGAVVEEEADIRTEGIKDDHDHENVVRHDIMCVLSDNVHWIFCLHVYNRKPFWVSGLLKSDVHSV